MPIQLAHQLAFKLAEVRKKKTKGIDWLRPDGKTQVSVRYEDGQHHRDRSDRRLDAARRQGQAEDAIEEAIREQVIKPIVPAKLVTNKTQDPHQPDRSLRDRWPARRRRPHRPQDHRRHLRRLRPPRRRRLLGQGSEQGRSLGRVLRALHREARRGGGPRATLRGPVRLRDRRRRAGLDARRYVRHRAWSATSGSPRPCSRLRRAPGALIQSSTCAGRSSARRPPTVTSAARSPSSRGSRPTRPPRCARPPASAPLHRPSHRFAGGRSGVGHGPSHERPPARHRLHRLRDPGDVLRRRPRRRVRGQALHPLEPGLLPVRPLAAGVDHGARLHLGEPRRARGHRHVGQRRAVRHRDGQLLLDRRHPGDGLPRPRDDAVLLRLEDPLGAGVPAAAVRRPGAQVQLDHVRGRHRADRGRQPLRAGARARSAARLAAARGHRRGRRDRHGLHQPRRAVVGDLQRGAPSSS